MKKLMVSFAAAFAVMASSAQAGKNVIPTTSDPIPVPVYAPLGLYLGAGLIYSSSECQCDPSLKCSNDGGKTLVSCAKVKGGKTYGVSLKAGYNITDYLAIEAKYIYTPWGDKNKTLKHYGLYLKPSYALNNNFDIYALLGYGKTECETIQGSQKGFAWGLGAEYTINKKVSGKKDGFGVYVEYLRPLKKTGNRNITVDMVNAGLSYHF